jgi:hypothetical protein
MHHVPSFDAERPYTLICEGPCNLSPSVHEVDAAFARLRHRTLRRSDERVVPLTVGLDAVDRARALHYTPHHMTRDSEATCDVCGTKRVYG